MCLKLFRVFALFTFVISLPGCSLLFFDRKDVTLNLNNEDVNVRISGQDEGKQSGYSHDFTSHEPTTVVRLPRNNKGMLVTLSKKGYRTKSYYLSKGKKLNKGRMIEAGVSVAFVGGGVTIMALNGEPDVVPILMVAAGIYDFCYTVFSKGMLNYRKSYDFEPLQKNPEWNTSLPRMMIDSANIKIDKNGLSYDYYNSVKHYEKGKKNLYNIAFDEKITINNTELSKDLNQILTEAGFQENMSDVFRDLDKYCRLSCDINGINIIYAGTTSRLKLNIKWSLMDYYSNVPYAVFQSEHSTNWISGAYGSYAYAKSIEEGLTESLYNLLSNEANIETFKNVQQSLISKKAPVLTTEIDSVYREKTKVSTCAKAVVTITTKKGHGSGCVISPEGFIISNYHVVENDPENSFVVFSDGEKLSYKIIAVDPGNDLALIKVDKKLEFCLSINFDEIKSGEEVFAIGTPTDVTLGQTVTKGIISGYQEFNSKKYYQTDASINSGNSGGALITKNGQLVGIVNAKVTAEDVQGIGFAIPLIRVKDKLLGNLK